MSEALAAAVLAVLVFGLFRRTRPTGPTALPALQRTLGVGKRGDGEESAPDADLWDAFDRGEDPTDGPPYGTI